MALLIFIELMTLRFAMSNMSAVRALVAGEGHWSKAQKDAILSLHEYLTLGDERLFKRFWKNFEVNYSDHYARIELEKPTLNTQKTTEFFIKGHFHPDDVPSIINLLKHREISFVNDAMEAWRKADRVLFRIASLANQVHEMNVTGKSDREMGEMMRRIEELNTQLTGIEASFSNALGEGSRWLERTLAWALTLLVLTIESTSIALTIMFSRSLSRTLKGLSIVTGEVAKGNFEVRAEVKSTDELGKLANSINTMVEELKKNVGERIQARQDLQTLSEVQEEREKFVAALTHDLLTPLTAARFYAEMIRNHSQASENQAKPLNKMISILDRLERMIEDLLDANRIRAGQTLPLNLERCRIKDLIKGIVSEFEFVHGERFETQIEDVVGFWSPKGLRRILENLIGNALKYGDPEKPIAISVIRNNSRVLLSVHNEGQGLSEKECANIFEPYNRQGPDRLNKKGWGIGLTLVRGFAESHGGGVNVLSRSGHGVTFVIELPLDARPYQELDLPSHSVL